MRTRAASAVLAGALIAGIVTGFIVLPQLFGNGVAITPAGTPSVPSRAPSTPNRHLGTAMLLQTDDLFALGLELDVAHQRMNGRQTLTGCTGRLTMADLTGAASDDSSVSASWHSANSATKARQAWLSESVARGATTVGARRQVARLTAHLTDCIYSDHGQGRYLGRPSGVPTDAGQAVRFISYTADGTPTGGVAVFRSGRNFGVFTLVASCGDKPGDVLDSLAATAVRRIA